MLCNMLYNLFSPDFQNFVDAGLIDAGLSLLVLVFHTGNLGPARGHGAAVAADLGCSPLRVRWHRDRSWAGLGAPASVCHGSQTFQVRMVHFAGTLALLNPFKLPGRWLFQPQFRVAGTVTTTRQEI